MFSPAHPAALVVLFVVPLATSAAQSINVDVGVHATFALPSSTFGGASGTPGVWNAIPISPGNPIAVVDTNGSGSGVTVTISGGFATASNTNLGGAGPDDLALLGDILDPGSVARTVTITGLLAGEYDLYTYAIAPDDPGFQTEISVGGSPDGLQVIGGAWPGSYVQGTTHARHRVTLLVTQDVVITVRRVPPLPMGFNFGSLNGLQIVRLDSGGMSFCAGDNLDPWVSTDCPCSNFGTTGQGCANSLNPSGASITASGLPGTDSVVLHGSGMPGSSACIYLQGDTFENAVFGDGVRCAGGFLLRLRSKINVGGASSFPDGTDTQTLSERGGVLPGSGALRFYQTFYRNSSSAFCPPTTFNVTSGWIVIW